MPTNNSRRAYHIGGIPDEKNIDTVEVNTVNSRQNNVGNKCCSAFQLFCMCTSVRGMSKLHKGPAFLRCAWTGFVISMATVLLVSVMLLILDFLNYDVGVHTRLLLDDPSPFPALTVCHHYPFSEDARKLWKANAILSPGRFNRYMRNLTLENLLNNNLVAAEKLSFYDSLSVYYQNLSPQDAKRLGHNHHIFINCMRMSLTTTFFEDDCKQLKGYRIRQFSHHQYLNCHTFEQVDDDETNFLGLIVSMGPKANDDVDEQAFLPDIFEQAKGLRVVIHEPGTYPDLEKFGLHAEPGKLNEIGYEPVRWTKLSTPKQPCVRANESLNYQDLDGVYNYTHEQCLLLYQQKEIIKECGCYYVMNPRPSFPSEKIPYCGRMWPHLNVQKFEERLQCLGGRLDISVKRKYDGTLCLPRCEYYTFDTTISITKWRVHMWQLYWLRVQNQAINMALDWFRLNPSRAVKENPGFPMWEMYLREDNLRNMPQHFGTISNETNLPDFNLSVANRFNLNNESFAYIILKRKSQSTIDNTEKLVLTLNVLASRIGGLCSVTIGITAGFVIEVVEFFYLLIQKNKTNKTIADRIPTRDGLMKVEEEKDEPVD